MSSIDKNAKIHESVVVIANTSDSSSTSGGLVVEGGLFSKDSYISGYVSVEDVNITPNPNDIIREIYFDESYFTITNEFANIGSLENDDLVYFRNSQSSSFVANIGVTTSDSYTTFTINGIRNGNNWYINTSFTGDITTIKFNINSTTITENQNNIYVGVLQYKNPEKSDVKMSIRVFTNSTYEQNPESNKIVRSIENLQTNKLVFSNSNKNLDSTSLSYNLQTNSLTTGSLYLNGDGLVIPVQESEPISPKTGQIYYNNQNTKTMKFSGYTGSEWNFFNQWETDSNNNIFYTSGNISIGTTESDNNSLNVNGNFKSQNIKSDITVSETYTSSNLNLGGNLNTHNLILSGGMTVGGHIIPSQDSVYDLGSDSMPWNDLYVAGNTINIGDKTISTDNGSILVDDLLVSNDMTVEGDLIVSEKLNINTTTGGYNVNVAGSVNISKDLVVSGNVSISGTQTVVNTETLNISDNIVVINHEPETPRDSGILFSRHINSILTDNYETSATLNTSGTNLSIPKPNELDDNYSGWWISVTKDENDLGSAQIKQSTGEFTFYTFGNTLDSDIPIGSEIKLYNKSNSSVFFDETNRELILGFVPNGSNPITDIENYDNNTNIKCGDIKSQGKVQVTNTLNVNDGVIYVSTTGNIGINTTSPNKKLDITGNMRSTNITSNDDINTDFLNISNDLKSEKDISCDNFLFLGKKDDLFKTQEYNTFEEFGNVPGTYIGGVLADNGKIYCSPWSADSILEIDPKDDTVSTFGNVGTTAFKWGGNVYAPNGKIYCIPYRSNHVLKIDPETQTVSTFGNISGDLKWMGGVLAPNGKIYGMPRSYNSVLEIDPETDTFSTFGNVNGGYWGGVLGPNGKIYGIPFSANSVLEIDPEEHTVSTFGNTGSYLGGVLARNGKIYGIPSDSSSVLEIDTETRSVSTFGNVGSGNTKWFGGILAPNGKIYGIPRSSTGILEIDPDNKITNLIGNFGYNYKWHGGVLSKNGDIYTMPNWKSTVLKINLEKPFIDSWILSAYVNKF